MRKIFISTGLIATLMIFGCGKTNGPQINNSHYEIADDGVYYLDGTITDGIPEKIKIEGADINSFQTLNDYYSKDKNKVYNEEIVVSPKFSLAPNDQALSADPNSFEVIDNYYGKDKDSVYEGLFKIADADPGSFKVLEGSYGKDKNSAYYRFSKIENSDPNTFVVIEKDKYSVYAKDKNAIYVEGFRKFEEADPESFALLAKNFSKDKNSVWYFNDKVEGADPASFQVIETKENCTSCDYGKDKNSVYHSKLKDGDLGVFKVEGADLSSFEVISYILQKDKNSIFCEDTKIKGSDSSTLFQFDPLIVDYWKEKSGVYWRCEKVEGADPDSFSPTSYMNAIDKNASYWRSEKQ